MAQKSSSEPIIIAVMGPTGSGKSNIIDSLSNTRWSGTSLKSVTDRVRTTKATLVLDEKKVEVTLVDTPGFDDTHRTDTEILRLIADWMEETYRKRISLTGILYLHRITDNRLAGTPYRNLKMFGKLCGDGEDVGRKVVFVTTMWDKLVSDPKRLEVGQRRGIELRQYWEPMLKLGARTAEFNNTREAAAEIVSQLIKQPTSGQATLLQEELVDLKRPLNETQAAQTLYSQFQTLLTQHRQTLVELERSAKATDNPTMMAELEVEKKRVETELNKTFKQVKELKVGFFTKLLRKLFGWGTKRKALELGT